VQSPASDIPNSPEQVTALLRRVTAGERDAAEDLMFAIGRELRRIAAIYMGKERANHTLQPTALMNEACLRLLVPGAMEWSDRNHFFATASQIMRQILVDHARARNAQRRGGDRLRVDLADAAVSPLQPELLDVDAALKELAAIAPRPAQLVELRFFGGLSLDEAAEVLEISSRTADKDWALARAWLRRRLG
jgi:RNA polymerase sigma factor (TIGR02999 family)